MFEGFEHLFSDVVSTSGVLQGKVEFVIVLDHVPTVVTISQRFPFTAPIPTVPVDVNAVWRKVFLKLPYKIFPSEIFSSTQFRNISSYRPTVGLAVGDQPGSEVLLLLLSFSRSVLLNFSHLSDHPPVWKEDV